tara:strand:+ start:669 stop:1322 length:654 start_codon:yes stop_codon:yes gene_type:complete
MFFKSVNSGDIKKANYFKNRLKVYTAGNFVNGQLVSTKLQAPKLSIARSGDALQKQQFVSMPVGASNADLAMEVLNTLGCSLIEKNKSFSLLDDQTDKTEIQNPNILDEDGFKKIKNLQKKADDKFSNVDDPFYKLDDAPSVKDSALREETTRKQKDRQKVILSSDISAINFDRDTKSLKYFKNIKKTMAPIGPQREQGSRPSKQNATTTSQQTANY